MTTTNVDAIRVAKARAVFTNLFDLLDAVDALGEQEWSDFIHIVNSTGRLMWGWTRLDSSESDVFAALDDITGTLERAKDELAGAAKELRETLDGPAAVPDAVIPAEIHQEMSGTTPLVTAAPAEEPAAGPASPAPDKATEVADRDVQLFEAIRANPAISYMDLAKLTPVTDGAIRYHFATLSKRGQLPTDIGEWRVERTTHTVGGANHPFRPDRPLKNAPKVAKPSKRVRQSAELAERILGATPAADPDPVLDRVHESLQPAVAEQFAAAAAIDQKPAGVVVAPFPAPAGALWAPACKSLADWTDWREANARKSVLNRLQRPCDDCPLAYALEKLKQGRCNGTPRGDGTAGFQWPPTPAAVS